ncbi:hypothetical protein EDM02_01390 [Candidatus Cardinium hertigii]|uniref:Uncharacterized protein n=1 Tax=Candidatus Cardinium hertigii TaxID=247481 RepID=A0A3N2QCV7_9BACT|nr:hypothetical protein EDM02_01390 [Candidatus Cardinium hertigii]
MSDSESNSTDGDSGYARVFPNVVQLSALDVHGVSGSVSHHTSPPPPPPPLPPSLFTRKVANSASVGQKFQAQLQYRHIPQAQLNKSQSRYRSRPQSSDTSNRIMNELNENKLFAKRRASQDVQS